QSAGWGNNSSHTVGINLQQLFGADIPASDINTILLAPTLVPRGPFEDTDNWNLQSLTMQHRASSGAITNLSQASQLTPYRFTINNPTAYVRVDDILDGGFEWQKSSSIVTPWFTEGPDAKGIDIGRML